jgi:NADP-dependent alcohol dehydrogenase
MPSVLRFKIRAKEPMLARYARNVWGVLEDNDRRAAERGIEMTEDFFRRMGLPVGASEIAPITISADDVVHHLEQAGQTALGESKDIGTPEVRQILAMAGD